MSKAGLWNHKPPRIKKSITCGDSVYPMLRLYELTPPALWSFIISSQLSTQNSCRCPDCGLVVFLVAEPSLSRPWVLDKMISADGIILHHACFRTDILSTTQVCRGLLHLCDKNRGEGGKASSQLMVSKVPVHCAGDSTAEQMCSHIPADQELESNWNQM